jgi:hypothetical protein
MLVACTNMQKPKQTLEEKQREIELGKLDARNNFEVEALGWKTTLPADWRVMTKRVNEKMNERGEEAMEKYYKSNVDLSKKITLIHLQKDPHNSFVATMDKFDSTLGAYEDQVMMVENSLVDMFKANNIHAEQFLGAVRIDGIMFDRIELKLFTADKKKFITEQKVFVAPINGHILVMNISFNNEKDEKKLLNTVMLSTFSIKE